MPFLCPSIFALQIKIGLSIIIHLFEYIKGRDCKSIYRCSNAILEILNQTKYDEYCKINKNGNDKEMEEYVDMEIDNEIPESV
jgi:hypothetical protein